MAHVRRRQSMNCVHALNPTESRHARVVYLCVGPEGAHVHHPERAMTEARAQRDVVRLCRCGGNAHFKKGKRRQTAQ